MEIEAEEAGAAEAPDPAMAEKHFEHTKRGKTRYSKSDAGKEKSAAATARAAKKAAEAAAKKARRAAEKEKQRRRRWARGRATMAS